MRPHPTRDVVVFDVDGTIADETHRAVIAPWNLRGTDGAGAAWDAYYAGVHDDTPIAAMFSMARALAEFGYRIVLATGRPERLRAATEAWLDRHNFPPTHDLLMRPADCRVGNAEMKVLHAATIGPERIALWVDDHPDVPAMLAAAYQIPTLALHNRVWLDGEEDPHGASR